MSFLHVDDTARRPEGSDRISAFFHRHGADVSRIKPAVLARLRLLDARTHTVEDEERAANEAQKVFLFCEKTHSENALSPADRHTVELALLLADIGKTGPARANAAEQIFMASVYSIENINIEMSLGAFLHQYFPHTESQYLIYARHLGLDPQMSMRAFYDLHVGWTFELLKTSGLPKDAILAAASHHLLEGNNPEHLLDEETGIFAGTRGQRSLDRRDMFVILLDKYDAARRRGRKTHDEAIQYLRDRIADPTNAMLQTLPPKFRQQFQSCIHDIDGALAHETLYAWAA